MGLGPISSAGKSLPITPWKGSWAAEVNKPLSDEERLRIGESHRNPQRLGLLHAQGHGRNVAYEEFAAGTLAFERERGG